MGVMKGNTRSLNYGLCDPNEHHFGRSFQGNIGSRVEHDRISICLFRVWGLGCRMPLIFDGWGKQ